MSHETTLCHIGMGGNIGDVFEAMQIGVDAIADHADCRVVTLSPVYRTAPWGLINQPDFLNCCAGVETSLDALAFLDVLQEIETSGGRQRDIRWGPRTLDIDLLTFGDLAIDSDRLEVPHPRMLERAFVLVPLADIASDLMIEGESVADHMGWLETEGVDLFEKRLRLPD